MLELKKLVVMVAGALVLTACGSSVKLDETAPIEDRNVSSSSADSRQVGTVDAVSTDPLNDPNGELAQKSVYFDFDSYVVKGEYQPVVDAHARYLNGHRNRTVVIQGNTDERGGSEYNLALGQKRAGSCPQGYGPDGRSRQPNGSGLFRQGKTESHRK